MDAGIRNKGDPDFKMYDFRILDEMRRICHQNGYEDPIPNYRPWVLEATEKGVIPPKQPWATSSLSAAAGPSTARGAAGGLATIDETDEYEARDEGLKEAADARTTEMQQLRARVDKRMPAEVAKRLARWKQLHSSPAPPAPDSQQAHPESPPATANPWGYGMQEERTPCKLTFSRQHYVSCL